MGEVKAWGKQKLGGSKGLVHPHEEVPRRLHRRVGDRPRLVEEGRVVIGGLDDGVHVDVGAAPHGV